MSKTTSSKSKTSKRALLHYGDYIIATSVSRERCALYRVTVVHMSTYAPPTVGLSLIAESVASAKLLYTDARMSETLDVLDSGRAVLLPTTRDDALDERNARAHYERVRETIERHAQRVLDAQREQASAVDDALKLGK